MSLQYILCSTAAVLGLAALVTATSLPVSAQQPTTVDIGATDLGGVVRGPGGPEAGVWVIAETTELPTKLAKIVVTDEQGRYVIPDLPKAKYKVWVRGYGLVDSPKVDGEPGKVLNLQAVPAPNEKEAAQYYPAIYWYAMLKIPAKSEFPGTGPQGTSGLKTSMKSQAEWLNQVKTSGCMSCHALGTIGTRTIPQAYADVKSSTDAWLLRSRPGRR